MILIAAVIGIGSASGIVVDAAEPYTLVDKAQDVGYAPCANEDSMGPCYWDATKRGNGKGMSFVVTDDNEVFYDYTQ